MHPPAKRESAAESAATRAVQSVLASGADGVPFPHVRLIFVGDGGVGTGGVGAGGVGAGGVGVVGTAGTAPALPTQQMQDSQLANNEV